MDSLYRVYLFKVKFQEKDEVKERPIVTFIYDNQTFSFEVLGVYSQKDKYKNNPYYKNFMYKIRDYKEAGLKFSSYINVARPFSIPFTVLINKSSFGKLTDYDVKKLIALYNQYWSNK